MSPATFTPFPGLQTERLLLRKLNTEDAAAMFFLRSDPRVLQYIGKEPMATQEEAAAFIETINGNIDTGTSVLWGITLKEDPATIIGTICLWNLQPAHFLGEIGFLLHPGYWKKGLMKEAIRMVMEYGFQQLQLHRVEARVNPANISSAAVLEATGFEKEGQLREDFYFRGRFQDTLVYARINREK